MPFLLTGNTNLLEYSTARLGCSDGEKETLKEAIFSLTYSIQELLLYQVRFRGTFEKGEMMKSKKYWNQIAVKRSNCSERRDLLCLIVKD